MAFTSAGAGGVRGRGPRFPARYPGHCPECLTEWDEGDLIGYVADSTELCHAQCADEAERLDQ